MTRQPKMVRFTKTELDAIMHAIDRFPINQYRDMKQREAARRAFLKLMDAAPDDLGYGGAVVPVAHSHKDNLPSVFDREKGS